jgi:hypothetical protein
LVFFISAIDTGGVFRDVTEIFWQRLKTHRFNGGRLFDGESTYMIQQNSELVEWEYATTLGKLLFWSWIHFGSWPKWLDQIHMQYVINGEQIPCKRALQEHIPYLYRLSEKIKTNGLQRNESDLRFWLNENGVGVSYINDLYS